ncbi:MAG: sulfate adenylyltransferase, partial [Cyanobacteria bacterium J06648_11]
MTENAVETIAPHGGTLVNRIATATYKAEIEDLAPTLTRVTLDARAQSDLEMIAIGGFSPLTGFMGQADYESVVTDMRTSDGTAWSVPVTLSVDEDVANSVQVGDTVGLNSADGRLLGVMELQEKYHYDKEKEAQNVYRTIEDKHPGVKVIYEQGQVNLAGPVTRRVT